MAGDEVRVWFDKAYSKMSLGDFAAAAECFEHVIKHCGDANAARIAEQRIQWYCVPLDAILKKMDDCQSPIDIHKVLAGLFAADVNYVESEQQAIIQAVEGELQKLPTVIRLGNRVWARKEIFSASLENLAQDIQRSPSPISISKWIKVKFIDCDLPENYPDRITLEVYEGELRQFPIHIFGNEFAITEEAWKAQVNFLANKILDAGKPVSSSSILKLLFPGITPEIETHIAPSIPVQLDSRFIEVTPGQIFLRDLLKLNSDMFEGLFGLSLEPKSTTSVVCFSLFPGQPNQVLTQRFQPIAEEQLAHNPNLINLRQSKWLAKAKANELYAQAEAYLLHAGTIQSTQAILDKISKTASMNGENQQLLISLIENHLNNCIDVIGIGNHAWIHSSFFRQAADRSYQELLMSKRALATMSLIKANLTLGKSNITQGLILRFEEFLSHDGRFVSESGQNSRFWRSVDPRKRDNHSVYEIFRRVHKLLTINAIEKLLIEENGITEPIMDLEDDERFKVFSADRWGLAEWVLINDYAFE
jgi:hypothetical protein